MAVQLSLPLVVFAAGLPFLSAYMNEGKDTRRFLFPLASRLVLFNLVAVGIYLLKGRIHLQDEFLFGFQIVTALSLMLMPLSAPLHRLRMAGSLAFNQSVPLLALPALVLISLYALYMNSPFLMLNLFALWTLVLHFLVLKLDRKGKKKILRELIPAATVGAGFLLLISLGLSVDTERITFLLSPLFEGKHSLILLVPVMFLLGFMTSLGPSTLPFLPVVFGVLVTRRKGRGEILLSVAGFCMAFVLTHSTTGALVSAGAVILNDLFKVELFNLILGLLLLLIAMNLLSLLPLRFNLARVNPFKNPGMNSTLLGVAYTFSLCPSCTSLLLGAVLISTSADSMSLSAFYMGIYAVGRAVPIFLSGAVVGTMSEFLKRNQPLINRTVGILFLLMSLYFFGNFLTVLI